MHMEVVLAAADYNLMHHAGQHLAQIRPIINLIFVMRESVAHYNSANYTHSELTLKPYAVRFSFLATLVTKTIQQII